MNSQSDCLADKTQSYSAGVRKPSSDWLCNLCLFLNRVYPFVVISGFGLMVSCISDPMLT